MNPDSITSLGTILGIWAHPDDEAFLSGGIMAMATDAGSRVVCVTATRGEAGSTDPERFPPHVIAKLRERELEQCLAILGVDEHHWLDYQDGTCTRVPEGEAAAKLVPIIEAVRPDTILTFGPEGFTDHADHRAVSRWAVEAHDRAARADTRQIHFATQAPSWVDEYGGILRDVHVFPPEFPPTTPVHELSVDARLTGSVNERKIRALRAQESQIEGLVQTLGLPLFTRAFAFERFRPARVDD